MLFIYPIYSRVYKCICTILKQSNQTIHSINFLYYPSNQTLLNILFSCYYFVTRDCSRFITQCRCWSWWRLLCVGDGYTWACNFDNKKHIAINNSFPTSFCWIKPYNSCNYDYMGSLCH